MVRGVFLFGRYLGGVKSDRIWKVFLQKLGSDLVVQSSRYGYPAQNFALYHLGMVPGGKVWKGFGKPWIFMTFSGGQKLQKQKHENAEWTWSDFGLQSSRPSQHDLLKFPENFTRFSAQKNPKFKGKRKLSDSCDPWPLASGLASAGRAKRKQFAAAHRASRRVLVLFAVCATHAGFLQKAVITVFK